MTVRLKGMLNTSFCPCPLEAVHLYSPASLSEMPTIVSTLVNVSLILSLTPVAKVSLVSSYLFALAALMMVPSLSQEMEGVGTPSAEQVKVTRPPAITVSP